MGSKIKCSLTAKPENSKIFVQTYFTDYFDLFFGVLNNHKKTFISAPNIIL